MRITVLMGGNSAERDVSLASGLRIAQALRSRGHEVVSLDPATGVIDGRMEAELLAGGVVKTVPPSLEDLRMMSEGVLSPSFAGHVAIRDADVVFLALHGGQGEDGTVQALLDMIRVRYTGSGHLASALAMDKDLTKRLFRLAGVTTPEWLMAPASQSDVAERVGYPAVVKPSKQGSTVGLTVVREPAGLEPAVDEAFLYDDEVMIERYISGRELTVSVLGDQTLPVGEIFPKHEIYDYECKYTKGMAVEKFPADLEPALTGELQRLALVAYRALKLAGCARVDFRMDGGGGGELHCLEANTLPGMTDLSLVPQAAAAAGIDFPELCERIVQLALDGRGTA